MPGHPYGRVPRCCWRREAVSGAAGPAGRRRRAQGGWRRQWRRTGAGRQRRATCGAGCGRWRSAMPPSCAVPPRCSSSWAGRRRAARSWKLPAGRWAGLRGSFGAGLWAGVEQRGPGPNAAGTEGAWLRGRGRGYVYRLPVWHGWGGAMHLRRGLWGAAWGHPQQGDRWWVEPGKGVGLCGARGGTRSAGAGPPTGQAGDASRGVKVWWVGLFPGRG